MPQQKLNERNIFNNEQKGNVLIHWRLQETKIFSTNKFHMKISNSEFFPNYGMLVWHISKQGALYIVTFYRYHSSSQQKATILYHGVAVANTSTGK